MFLAYDSTSTKTLLESEGADLVLLVKRAGRSTMMEDLRNEGRKGEGTKKKKWEGGRGKGDRDGELEKRDS